MAQVYGIVGWIGSGKDTVANYIVDNYSGWRRVSFARPLKDALSVIFGWDRELLDGISEESRAWREQVDPWWSERLQIPSLTPRWILQHIGTDVMRNHFHNEIWIAAAEQQIQRHLDQGLNVIVSDCRFHNELKAIQKHNGNLIEIHRDSGVKPAWLTCAIRQNTASAEELEYLQKKKLTMEHLWPGIHPSEWSWVGLKTDYQIQNTGSLEQLYQSVDQLMFQSFVSNH